MAFKCSGVSCLESLLPFPLLELCFRCDLDGDDALLDNQAAHFANVEVLFAVH